MFLSYRTYILIGLVFFLLFFIIFRKRKEINLAIRKNPRISIFVFTIFVIGTGLLLYLVNTPGISLDRRAEEIPSINFTFFEVGENTILTKDLIKKLDKVLGPHRLENLTSISFEYFGGKFFTSHSENFKDLGAFFNTERLVKPIAAKTLKLDYRYTAQHAPPFTNVHFVFSDYSKKPLFIRMRLEGKGEETLKSIESKYGSPKEAEGKKALSPVLFWEKGKDMLVFALVPDRYGKPEAWIFIAYGENLEGFKEDILKNYPEPAPKTGF